jgi:hypothetical protein
VGPSHQSRLLRSKLADAGLTLTANSAERDTSSRQLFVTVASLHCNCLAKADNAQVDTRRLQLLLSDLKVRGEISSKMAKNGEFDSAGETADRDPTVGYAPLYCRNFGRADKGRADSVWSRDIGIPCLKSCGWVYRGLRGRVPAVC